MVRYVLTKLTWPITRLLERDLKIFDFEKTSNNPMMKLTEKK